MSGKNKKTGGRKRKRGKNVEAYSYQMRLRAVKLHEENGLSYAAVAGRLGMNDGSVYDWVRRYRSEGAEGLKLRTQYPGPGRKSTGGPVKGQKAGKSNEAEYAYSRSCPFEVKLKAVKLYVEEGLPSHLVAKEVGVCNGTVFDWVRQYRTHGEAGLKPRYGHRTKNISPVVKEKITAVKKSNPTFGVRRITDVVRRVFFLKTSQETVRKTLKEEDLVEKPKKKRRRPRPKVKRFERAKPNQLWQSDIFTFRLLERNAYLIAFMDDHSRYIVSCGLFRSQRADQVIEVYRDGIGQYGVPREVLTDNGRQYAAWRGKSKFTRELDRDGVHHIRSATHHPQTLGKVERFWRSIWEEFLGHARFERFEEARERISSWVKYYNHQRPHQGIEGACPAERFFKIQHQLREVIEKGVSENAEEIALHGRPKRPFYMVGRVGEKSVVITKDGDEMKVEERIDSEEQVNEKKTAEQSRAGGSGNESEGEEDGAAGIRCPREGGSGPECVGGEAETPRGAERLGDQLCNAVAVAEPSDGCNADGAGAEEQEGRRKGTCAGAETEASSESEPEGSGGETGQTGTAASGSAGNRAETGGKIGMPANGYALLGEKERPIVARLLAEMTGERQNNESGHGYEQEAAGNTGAGASGSDTAGTEQADDGLGSGEEISGGEPENVLQMGKEVPVGRVEGGCGPECGPSDGRGGRGEGGASAAGSRTGETGGVAEADGPYPGSLAAEGPVALGPFSKKAEEQKAEPEAA